MSFKALDMQMAVHKNSDAGLKQNQFIQKPITDQALLSQSMEKSTLAARQLSSKIEETANHRIRDERSGNKHLPNHSSEKQSHDHNEEDTGQHKTPPEHPYKGKHIDLSL